MKEKWKTLPEALRKTLLIRYGVGILALLLFTVILIYNRDLYMALPCLILSGFLLATTGQLMYTCLRGNYLKIEGICTEVQSSGIRKRTKALQVNVSGIPLQIHVKQRLRGAAKGDHIILYLSDKTPVYSKDGIHVVYNYYALETRKGELYG